MTFMDRAVAGSIPESEWKATFEREIKAWSLAEGANIQRQIARGAIAPLVGLQLHDHLGITAEEYDAWCADTDLVFRFVAERRAAMRPAPASSGAFRSEQEFDAACARVKELMWARLGTPEHEELVALSDRVETYDRIHHPVAPPTPEEAAAFRAEQEIARPATTAPAPQRPLRIYLAMSWKHPRHAAYVAALRAEGHEVFDFKAPPGGKPLGTWKHLLSDPRNSTAAQQAKALRHDDATTSLAEDYEALQWADVVLAVGPFGVSTGVELGWAISAGKRTAWVLADGPAELMPALAERVCETFEDALAWLSDLDRTKRPERCVLTTFGSGSKRVACILRPAAAVSEPDTSQELAALRARAERAEARCAEWAHVAQRVLAWSYDAFDGGVELNSRASLRSMLAGGIPVPDTRPSVLSYSLRADDRVWWLPEGSDREYMAQVEGDAREDSVDLCVVDDAYPGPRGVIRFGVSVHRLRRREV